MTTVNFYQVDITNNINNISLDEKVFKIICDLIFENYQKNKNINIYILCDNQRQCYKLDEYIINYQEKNFFPYQILEVNFDNNNSNNNLSPPAKICLSTELTPKLRHEVLINLTNSIPTNFLKYRLIIEIIIPDEQTNPDQIARGNILKKREHYKYYQQHQCTNNFMKL